MKLAIITPTCRENPRLKEASRTLAASLAHAGDGVQLLWIIVDEKGRDTSDLVDVDATTRPGLKFAVTVIDPLPSVHRQPNAEKAPAHNAARGAGLLFAMNAGADYVCWLNDCNVVTYGIISVIRDCYKQNVGYRARMHDVADMAIPDDGRISYKDHHDLLRPIPVKTACGAFVGAPMHAWRAINGFDRSYDGERYGNDLDAVIRLSRVGVPFVTTERAFVIQLRRTKTSQEITTRKDAAKGVRNRALINQLERERERIHPLWPADQDEPTPVLVAEPEPELDSGEPKPKWKKRAPPIVGGRRPQSSATPPTQRRQTPVVGAQRLPLQNQVTPAKPRPAPAAPARVDGNGSGAAPLPPPPDAPLMTIVIPPVPDAPDAPPPHNDVERVATDDELEDFMDEGGDAPA